LADAGHMLFDLLALGVAIGAIDMGRKAANATHTWGYKRFEVLGALINSLLLVGVSVGIGWEAMDRWFHPEPLSVGAMLGVAIVGLMANLVSLAILGSCHGNLGVRGALLHVIGDTLSSVGVILGAVCIWYTGYGRIDALLSAVIALILVVGSWNLLRDVTRILLEAAPPHIQTRELKGAMEQVMGVHAVIDLHVWNITSGVLVLSAHVILAESYTLQESEAVRGALQQMLATTLGRVHTTLQIEPYRDSTEGRDPWLTAPIVRVEPSSPIP
jgi:cobalt-zinc-cadmium efflux system protein